MHGWGACVSRGVHALREGVCTARGHVCPGGACMLGEACMSGGSCMTRGMHAQGADTLPHPGDGHCSRRYASYWNAFLLLSFNHFGHKHFPRGHACLGGPACLGAMHVWGVCMPGGLACPWQRGHAWWRGVCMAKGRGVHGEGGMHGGGHAWQRGGMHSKGGHAWQKGGMHGMHTPPLRDTASQCAGGTHPTGMHSCFFLTLLIPK